MWKSCPANGHSSPFFLMDTKLKKLAKMDMQDVGQSKQASSKKTCISYINEYQKLNMNKTTVLRTIYILSHKQFQGLTPPLQRGN